VNSTVSDNSISSTRKLWRHCLHNFALDLICSLCWTIFAVLRRTFGRHWGKSNGSGLYFKRPAPIVLKEIAMMAKNYDGLQSPHD